MKIHQITTGNFLGARAVDLRLSKPVALIAGKNGAGKSSVRDAIALAFTADLGRVSLKKEAAQLISQGADSGFVEIVAGENTYGVAITAAGKISDTMAGKETPAALPYILDAQRFARMTENDRRSFLFGLMGVKMDGPTITKRMLAKGLEEAKVEQISPILRAGFDAASKEAANKARDAKASWKTATGGETWGKDKSAQWAPPALEYDGATAQKLLDGVLKTIALDEEDINKLNQEIGAAKAEIARRESGEARRLELHDKASKIDRIQEKLNVDTAELAAWEQKVADCRARAGGQPNPKDPGQYLLRGLASVTGEFLALSNDFPEVDWPSDLINRAAAHHAEFVKLHGDPVGNDAGPDPEAAAKLPEYEKALELMKRAVANGKRDLEAAQAAKAEYDRVVTEQNEPLPKVDELQAKLKEITTRRDTFRADERKYSEMVRQAAGREALVKQVTKLHADVLAWTDIADALAPDGIPAELLAEALGPINERLHDSSGIAEWKQVVISSDMRITYGGRDYTLASESEKWRADAMIAEAVSHISGLKLLVLDRFDVLDLKGREDLLFWLDDLAAINALDSAIIFGTLKALPALNLDNIGAHWIENGAAGQLKEAA